jgi:hypothetical protein
MTSEAPNEPASQHSEDVASAGITRRSVVRAASASAPGLGLGGVTATAAQPASAATRKGPGSIARAPDLPPGFTSRFIHANGPTHADRFAVGEPRRHARRGHGHGDRVVPAVLGCYLTDGRVRFTDADPTLGRSRPVRPSAVHQSRQVEIDAQRN